MKTMINETRMIPTQNKVALMVTIGIRIKLVLKNGSKFFDLARGKYLIKRIEYPGDSPFGDKAGCNYSITNLRVYELELCVRVNHNW